MPTLSSRLPELRKLKGKKVKGLQTYKMTNNIDQEFDHIAFIQFDDGSWLSLEVEETEDGEYGITGTIRKRET